MIKIMTKNDLIDRIQKLLALSYSSNQNEASIALARAKKLMEQHHIDESDLNNKKIDTIKVATLRGLTRTKEVSYLLLVLQKAFGIRPILSNTSSSNTAEVIFIGPVELLPTIEYLFVTLSRGFIRAKKSYSRKENLYRCALRTAIKGGMDIFMLIQRNANAKARKIASDPDASDAELSYVLDQIKSSTTAMSYLQQIGTTLKASYVQGYFDALLQKVEAYVNPKEIESSIDKCIEDQMPALKGYKMRSRPCYKDGFDAGAQDGLKVDINTPVQNSASSLSRLTKK